MTQFKSHVSHSMFLFLLAPSIVRALQQTMFRPSSSWHRTQWIPGADQWIENKFHETISKAESIEFLAKIPRPHQHRTMVESRNWIRTWEWCQSMYRKYSSQLKFINFFIFLPWNDSPLSNSKWFPKWITCFHIWIVSFPVHQCGRNKCYRWFDWFRFNNGG